VHKDKKASMVPLERVVSRIFLVRGQKVMLDADLAKLYGVPTRRLNEQVRRNADRFPEDFAFQMTNQELAILMSQNATSSRDTRSHGGRRKRPLVLPNTAPSWPLPC
jgi:hypothetical protein